MDRVFFYGREYHMMPRALLHAISRTMADVLPSCKGSAGKAQENLKKNLNETRKAAKAEDHVSVLGFKENITAIRFAWETGENTTISPPIKIVRTAGVSKNKSKSYLLSCSTGFSPGFHLKITCRKSSEGG